MTWAARWPEKGWRREMPRVWLRQRALSHSTHLPRGAAISAAPKSRRSMREIRFVGAQGQQTLRIQYFLSSYLFWGAMLCGTRDLIPQPGIQPRSLHWEPEVLTPGPPGKSLSLDLN